MFHSAEQTVAMDVTVPQAAHVYPSSNPAFHLLYSPHARQFDVPSAVRQQDYESNFRTSPRSDSTSEAMFAGSRHYPPAADPGSPGTVRVTPIPCCPESLDAKHPMSWSKDDVEEWLDWCIEEFALDDVQRKFSMNGKALCILSKEDFRYRTPNAGDLLHEVLQKLLSRGEEPTRPVYEPSSRFRTSDKSNRDCCSNRYKSSDDNGGKPNIPEVLPLNLKKTDNAHETYSSSGHSTPHANLDEESQSAYPMAAVRHGYPPHLPPYPMVHPKTLQKPRCEASVLEASTYHGTTAGQNTRRHIHSPMHCSSPPSRKSPTSHSLSGNLNPKRNLPPYYTSSLPNRQSHTGAEFAMAIEDYNPQRNHHHEMMEAHQSSSEGHKNSSTHLSGDLSFDKRPVLRDILTGTSCRPSSVLPYNKMKVHGKVHVPVIQETAAASTNGNTCTKVITDYIANQRSASISFDALAHQRVPFTPFSHQYSYRLAPCVSQSLTSERSTPSVFSNTLDVQNLCEPKVEAATSEMDCDVKHCGASKKKGYRPLLWQFLWLLLKDKNNCHYICWEDEARLVFRIIDTDKVAKLWGKEKNRLNMTYEKMSRGMRYYYKTGILCKEPGQKLTYRFLKTPKDLANSKCFSKNKMKVDAAYNAASAEARIFQEADTPKSDCSERDPDPTDEMSTSESASTTIMASSPRCDSPITLTIVAKEDIKIKEECDGYQA